jgi:hypothetical protein
MIHDILLTRKEGEMKVGKIATAFMLMLACLFALLLWANIRAVKQIPERHVWEIKTVKVRCAGEVVIPPGWEIMDYDKATQTIYLKRRVDENTARKKEVTKKRIDRLLL